MANKRVIELNERTQIDMSDWLLVDSSTSTRKLSIATLLSYFTYYSLIFVEELPTQDIQPNVVYLVPHSGSNTQWDEYIYINNDWDLIGVSTIDLSAIYQTKAAATVQNDNIHWYGTSSTAAATTAKVATTAAGNLGALAAGQKVSIKFTNANTASAPTLNVDGKGAHAIKAYGTTAPTVWWKAGDVVTFTYDGTNWIMGATHGEIEQINSDLMSINNWQLVTEYTYTPSATGQIYVNEKIGEVDQNARRVGVAVVQAGDVESFVELAKGHSTNILEFDGSNYLVNWVYGNQCWLSYAKFELTNSLTIKLYQVI